MFKFKFKKQITSQSIVTFLEERNLSKEKSSINNTSLHLFAQIYQSATGEWFLLGALETPPAGITVYSLSEKAYMDFLDTNTPEIEYDTGYSYSEALAEAEAEARKTMIAVARGLLHHNLENSKTKSPALSEFDLLSVFRLFAAKKNLNEVQDHYTTLSEAEITGFLQACSPEFIEAIAQLPDAFKVQPDELATCVNIGLQDGIWMLQSTATEIIATDYAAPTVITNTRSGLGILFGIGASLAMGVGCGVLAKQIYEHKAIAKFTELHGRKPSSQELQLIRRDAKHLGYKVFASVTGWSMAAAIIQTAFDIFRLTNGFHPAGILFNAVVSIAAGAGEAIGVCTAHHQIEKSKFYEKYEEKKEAETAWHAHIQTSEYKWSMAKLAVSSFVAGFAWNMISSYVPRPAQTLLKKIGNVILTSVVTTFVTGLTNVIERYLTNSTTKPKQQPQSKVSILFQEEKKNIAPTQPLSSEKAGNFSLTT